MEKEKKRNLEKRNGEESRKKFENGDKKEYQQSAVETVMDIVDTLDTPSLRKKIGKFTYDFRQFFCTFGRVGVY
jgi:ribosomal protein S25